MPSETLFYQVTAAEAETHKKFFKKKHNEIFPNNELAIFTSIDGTQKLIKVHANPHATPGNLNPIAILNVDQFKVLINTPEWKESREVA
jgi:hypothetical protein